MSDVQDPLIHGPGAQKQADQQPSGLLEEYDLEKTNPLQDLPTLFFKSQSFFLFFKNRADFSKWVWLKAFLGIYVISALIIFSQQIFYGQFFDHFFTDFMTDSQWNPFWLQLEKHGSWHREDIHRMLSAALMGSSYYQMITGPLFSILYLLLLAAGAAWALPWVGVERSKVKFSHIFVSFCYSSWWAIFALIPGIGGLFAAILSFVMKLRAVAIQYDISKSRAFFAIYGVWYLISFLIAAAFFVGIFIFIALLKKNSLSPTGVI